MRLGHCPLMVTQDGHHTICLVVRIEFLLKRSLLRRVLVELLLEGDGSVVGTEDLGCETLHVRRQMLVQRGRLQKLGETPS
jgi:ABC-type cobalamin transport system ATPase subunit